MNEEDEAKEQFMEMLRQATESTCERITRAGWAETGLDTKDNIVVKWTEKGIEASRLLMSLVDQLGPELNGAELGALLNIINTVSPWGKESGGGPDD